VKLKLSEHLVESPMITVPVSGACAGIAYWTWSLPFDSVKTLMQTSTCSFREAWSKVNVKQMYKSGYTICLARGIPGAAITFTVQTTLSNWIDANILN
jgi:hypothetical protein